MKRLLIVGMAIIMVVLLGVSATDNMRYESQVREKLAGDLEKCQSIGLKDCHIELWHDKNGEVIGGEVVGRYN